MADEVVKEKGKRGARKAVEKKFLVVSSVDGNGKVVPSELNAQEFNIWANNPLYSIEVKENLGKFNSSADIGEYLDLEGYYTIARVR
jgi:hypothetical protein